RFRQHLLGSLSASEQERLADDLVIHEGLYDELDQEEQALIADFLESRLSHADRQRFEQAYSSPEQIAKLQLAQLERFAGKNGALAEEAGTATSPGVVSIPRRDSRARRGHWLAIAAEILILIAFYFFSTQRIDSLVAENDQLRKRVASATVEPAQ